MASDTKLVQKVAGFWRSVVDKENTAPQADAAALDPGSREGSVSQGPLHALLALLRGLRSVDADARIILDPGAPEGGSVRFILVDAGRLFAKVSRGLCEVARRRGCVALGGVSLGDGVVGGFPHKSAARHVVHRVSRCRAVHCISRLTPMHPRSWPRLAQSSWHLARCPPWVLS